MLQPANLEEILQLNPDYVGFIFYEKSPRYVGDRPDAGLFSLVPSTTEKVAVVVNSDLEDILELVNTYGFTTVQLHGDESPELCRELSSRGVSVIKAIPAAKTLSEQSLKPYLPFVSYFLLDTPGKGYGGTGRKFDWKLLRDWQTEVPFFLSGGIGINDAPAILALEHPQLYGIDLNSRFEQQPGIKDEVLLRAFMEKIRDGKQIKI